MKFMFMYAMQNSFRVKYWNKSIPVILFSCTTQVLAYIIAQPIQRQGSIRGGGKIFFSTPIQSVRLWSPPILLANLYRRTLSTGSKTVGERR
jgi:hypothetical protein